MVALLVGTPSVSVIPHKGLRSRPERTVSAPAWRCAGRNVRVAGSRAREVQVAAMTRFALVPGGRLAYDVAGAGDPPMIFVHGWCCDRSHFAPQVTHFSASHAVATMDLRGHGESSAPDPGPGGDDIAALADDVLAVAAAGGLQRPVLVGHSLGALAGLVCAARPGAISALVMVDPAPITNEQAKAFFRDSVDVVRADADQSWRTAFAR